MAGSAAWALALLVACCGFAASIAGVSAAGATRGSRYAYDWSGVDKTLQASIADKVMPGCVAAVASKDGTLYLKAHGRLTYGAGDPVSNTDPPVDIDTLYDLASLTKVTATTTATMQFYQRGELDLDMPIADPYLLGPRYANNGKATIVSRNCLLHDAGYPPDPVPDYWNPAFGCPATADYHPAETFDCNEKIFQSLLDQTLINPVGDKYVYSDLSMITMQFVIGTLADKLGYVTPDMLLPGCAGAGEGLSKTCHYEAYVRHYVFAPLGMNVTGFLPNKEWWANTAPTWDDTTYRHRYIQGQVSDGNSYALGGVAGHAGVFSTAPQLLVLMKKLMFATEDDTYVNATTVHLFTKAYNLTQSSRAFGWDTNNYVMNTYRGCGNLSSLTYTHLGYTGTELCNDPTRQLITVLLTNRCYPNKTGNLGPRIQHARRSFNNAVMMAFDAGEAARAVRTASEMGRASPDLHASDTDSERPTSFP